MCGRYDLNQTAREVASWFRVRKPVPETRPRYNVAPTQTMPVVRLDAAGEREVALLRWGLVPSWARDEKIGYSTINARAETVAEKPAFRAAFRKRRCIVPATGYFEWQAGAGGKQPWRFVPAEGGLFGFAGLWERWQPRAAPDEPAPPEPIETYSIIVTQANALSREIHDRMPVILDPDHYDAWLRAVDTTIPLALLQPYPAKKMRAYPVSKLVNSPRNDTPACIVPLD